MIDTEDLLKSTRDFAESIGGYLDLQVKYFDHLRNRPKFFFGITQSYQRLAVIKVPVVKVIEEEEKEKCLPSLRKPTPVPVPVPLPVAEAAVEEPVQQPVREPVAQPQIPIGNQRQKDKEFSKTIEDLTKDLPQPEVPKVIPARPPVQVPKPLETPKQPQYLPIGVEFDPARPHLQQHPKTRMTGTDLVGDLLTLAGSALAVFGLPALFGGGAVTTTAGGVAGTTVSTGSKIVQFSRQAAPAANNIQKFQRALQGSKTVQRSAQLAGKLARGGASFGLAPVLVGEAGPEASVPVTKLGEFVQSIYREIGSVFVGVSDALLKTTPANSAIKSKVAMLRSKFGIDDSFVSPLPKMPSAISFDTEDVKAESDMIARMSGMLPGIISGTKNIIARITGGQLTPSNRPPGPDPTVIIPSVDPSMIGADVKAAGKTGGNMVSGYPITSAMAMRLHPILGKWMPHGGYDISAPMGTGLALGKPGEIVFAGPKGGYGNMIDAWIPSLSVQFRLAHLSAFAKRSGTFRAGELLGLIGSTGLSTGPHLHFEVDRTKGGTAYGGSMDKSLTGSMTQYIIMGNVQKSSATSLPSKKHQGPVIGKGGYGLKPDGTHGLSKVGDKVYDPATKKTYELVPRPGYGYNQWIPVKQAQRINENLVAQDKTANLQISRVNSIVPIVIQGPTQYTTNIVPMPVQVKKKRVPVISPLSKGVIV